MYSLYNCKSIFWQRNFNLRRFMLADKVREGVLFSWHLTRHDSGRLMGLYLVYRSRYLCSLVYVFFLWKFLCNLTVTYIHKALSADGKKKPILWMLIYLELLHYHPPGYTEQLICDSIFKLINLLLILFFF